MYSHGSSARVDVGGKRGHGGREYRPPRRRQQQQGDDKVPPPLKECNCLVQLDVAEYLQRATEVPNEGNNEESGSGGSAQRRRQRLHISFQGIWSMEGGGAAAAAAVATTLEVRRRNVQACERQLRSQFGVHLVIPGKNQQGPIAVAGKTYREVLAATACLLQQHMDITLATTTAINNNHDVVRNEDEEEEFCRSNRDNYNDDDDDVDDDGSHSNRNLFLTGRIQRNVKDPQDVILEGRWHQVPSSVEPYWLFESESWNVIACPLLHEVDEENEENKSKSSSPSLLLPKASSLSRLQMLRRSLDNLQFELGNDALKQLVIWKEEDSDTPSAFAAGSYDAAGKLFQHVTTSH